MKKLISSLLACIMLFSCCSSAVAVGIDIYASLTLSIASASASTGTNSGEVIISYRSRANKTSSPVGVSSIAIYKADGTYVTTIRGTTSNGLMANNATVKNGTYKYKGTSGTSYYAKVTISATAGGESDSRTITTNTARAK